jgi:NTE family protein
MRLPASLPSLAWLTSHAWVRMFAGEVGASNAPSMPRIGLALSCGGARGLAHIGVIQVLEREGIPISAIIGSSMGAYIGALWASGINGEGLEKLAAEMKDRRALLRLMDWVLPPFKGFVHGHKIRKHLERTLGTRTIGQLDRPLFIVATALDTVSDEVLPADTPVAAAVQASCAIPGIISPSILNGKRYIDGGAAQPMPVTLLRKLADVESVIAVNVIPTLADISSAEFNSYPMPPPKARTLVGRLGAAMNSSMNLFAYGNVLDTFKRCLTVAQMRLVAEESTRADVVIHPFFSDSRWHDFHNFNRYLEAGRKAAEEALPAIRQLLKASPTNHLHETIPLISTVGCGRS